MDEIYDNESLDEMTREVIVQKYVERISFPVDHCWLHPIPKPKNIINYFEGVPEEAIALDSWHFCSEEGGSSKAYVDKFNMAVKRITPKSEIPEGIPRFFKNSAPEMANNVPILDLPNT
mgnify:CR=1 FL=1